MESNSTTPRTSCWVELDKLYMCATPKHQFESIYRTGEFDNCRKLTADMWACMRGGEARRKAEAEAASAASEAPDVGTEAPIWQLKAVPRWEYGDGVGAEAVSAPSTTQETSEAPRRRGLFRSLTK